MNDTKETPWDSMFIDPEKRAATSALTEKQQKIEAGLRNVLDHIRPEPSPLRVINFRDNLEYIHDWSQREMLGLLIDRIDLAETSFDFLDNWRKDYQVPPEDKPSPE